jgi:hypothetical protein
MTLATVLGVGRDSQDTIYLADEIANPFTDRVFVSEGQLLWRKRVAGSGQSGSGTDADYTFSYEDGANLHGLAIQIRGGVTTAMALAPPDARAFVGDPAITEVLEVLDRSAIDGMTVRNLPGEVAVEYVADVADGHVIVVTRPLDDWVYEDFRVFYGTPEAMTERAVIAVSRAKDGGSTTIAFGVGSATYVVAFTVVTTYDDAGAGFIPGPATLSTGGAGTQAVTQRTPAPSELDGYSFVCR